MRVEGIDLAKMAQAVKEKRKEKGLSQQALGEKINMSGGFVGWIETGRADKLKEGKVENILSFLGLSLSEFSAAENKTARKPGRPPAAAKKEAAMTPAPMKKEAAKVLAPVKKEAAKAPAARKRLVAKPPVAVKKEAAKVEEPAPVIKETPKVEAPAPVRKKAARAEVGTIVKKAASAVKKPVAAEVVKPVATPAPQVIKEKEEEKKVSEAPHAQGGKPEPKASEYTGRAARKYGEWVRRKVPIEVKLDTGELCAGYLKWYDQSALKLVTNEGRELVMMKNRILYIIDAPRG